MVHHDELQSLFLETHRDLIQGLKRILECLEADDRAAAIAAADELDRVAGPHIEFEETVFYPLLVKPLGRESVDQLYQEHAAGLAGLRRLLSRDEPLAWGSADREAITEQMQIALDHATSCGTLLSHVATLDEEIKARILDLREEIESRACRWTELHAQG